MSEAKEHFGAGLPPGFIPLPPPSERKAEDARPPGFQEVKPPWQGDGRGVIGGAVMDTLGLTDRPGADTPKRVLTKPETFGESLIAPAIMAPAIMYGGTGAAAMGLPALAGRIAASGALGAAQSAWRGDDAATVGTHGAMDAAVSGLTEGLGGVAAKAAGKVAKPLTKAIEENQGMQRGFKYATDAVDKAYDAVKGRIPPGKWFTLPSVSNAKMTAQEAFDALRNAEGDSYRIIREDIQKNLDRLDSLGRKGANFAASSAGRVFKMLTSDARFTPPEAPTGTMGEAAAKRLGEIAQHPRVRSTLDALANALFPGSRAPIGAHVAGAVARPLAKHVPGAKAVTEVVEEAE